MLCEIFLAEGSRDLDGLLQLIKHLSRELVSSIRIVDRNSSGLNVVEFSSPSTIHFIHKKARDNRYSLDSLGRHTVFNQDLVIPLHVLHGGQGWPRYLRDFYREVSSEGEEIFFSGDLKKQHDIENITQVSLRQQ